MTVTPLAQFLLACIAEDEATARAVEQERPWRAFATDVKEWVGRDGHQGQAFGVGEDLRDPQDYPVCLDVGNGGEERRESIALHIAGWDPTRVLAECDAKRRIVLQASAHAFVADEVAVGAGQVTADVTRSVMQDVLKSLALPYAGRPGFREQWRP